MATKAKTKASDFTVSSKGVTVRKASTAVGRTDGIKTAAKNAAMAAAAVEFKAQTKPRVRKSVAKVAAGTYPAVTVDKANRVTSVGRGLTSTSTPIDELGYAPTPVSPALTETDINRLVRAFQAAQPCAPKVDEEPKTTAKEAPPTALSTNMRQVESQFSELATVLSVLEQQLQPVLNQAEASADGEPSQVEYEGNSSVNSFLRKTAGNIENLTARIKALINRLEI